MKEPRPHKKSRSATQAGARDSHPRAMIRTHAPLRPRFALFTHDTFGLGHIRRSLHIIRALADRYPHASLLLVTGSQAVHRLQQLPKNMDYIKIPTIVQTGTRGSQPPNLSLPVQEMTRMRERLIRTSVCAFRPDVFIVDNFPLGSRSELLPTLQELEETATRTVLGLRDILDKPETVQSTWTRDGLYDVIDRYYDRILVYGVRSIFDLGKAYQLPSQVAAKLAYCGYVAPPDPITESPAQIRRQLGVKRPFVLAMGGGGGDAYPLLSTCMEALKQIPRCSALVLTGPLMGAEDQQRLKDKRNGHDHVQIREFVPDVRAYLNAADVVVSMCGYNTASEIVSQRPNSIVVPRTWRYGEHAIRMRADQEGEQIMRAHALDRRGIVHCLEPQDLTPERLAAAIQTHLKKRSTTRTRLRLNGLQKAAEEIGKLL